MGFLGDGICKERISNLLVGNPECASLYPVPGRGSEAHSPNPWSTLEKPKWLDPYG